MATLATAMLLGGCVAQAPARDEGGASDPGATTPPDLGGDDFVHGAGVSTPHRRFPSLAHAGSGGVLSPMRLVVATAAGDPLGDALTAFGDAVPKSRWFASVTAEYGVAAPRPSDRLTLPPLPAGAGALSLDDVEAWVQMALASTRDAPRPDGATMYLVYLPAGVDLDDDVGCKGPGPAGYHRAFGSGGDALGVVQRCQGGFAHLMDMLTIVGSHEIAEAATDTGAGWRLPVPSSSTPPWHADPWLAYEESRVTENGDLCTDTRVAEGGYYYQRSFSNAAAAAGGDPCVPALEVPYYGASTARAWYAASAGTTLEIPVTGWSATATSAWRLYARIANQSDGAAFTASAGGAEMNDGTTATLSVTVPPDAPSGAWAAVYLMSARRDALGQPIDGEDFAHLQMVGVYVP